jgi:hypothetical protein
VTVELYEDWDMAALIGAVERNVWLLRPLADQASMSEDEVRRRVVTAMRSDVRNEDSHMTRMSRAVFNKCMDTMVALATLRGDSLLETELTRMRSSVPECISRHVCPCFEGIWREWYSVVFEDGDVAQQEKVVETWSDWDSRCVQSSKATPLMRDIREQRLRSDMEDYEERARVVEKLTQLESRINGTIGLSVEVIAVLQFQRLTLLGIVLLKSYPRGQSGAVAISKAENAFRGALDECRDGATGSAGRGPGLLVDKHRAGAQGRLGSLLRRSVMESLDIPDEQRAEKLREVQGLLRDVFDTVKGIDRSSLAFVKCATDYGSVRVSVPVC